jgi:hypothetical protein
MKKGMNHESNLENKNQIKKNLLSGPLFFTLCQQERTDGSGQLKHTPDPIHAISFLHLLFRLLLLFRPVGRTAAPLWHAQILLGRHF